MFETTNQSKFWGKHQFLRQGLGGLGPSSLMLFRWDLQPSLVDKKTNQIETIDETSN